MNCDSEKQPIQRHKTAIYRYQYSKPVSLALGDGVLQENRSVLDYGCGRGADVRLLKKKKFDVSGWDPYYRPETPLESRDVVLLLYVLNVIEDPEERAEALHKAFELARQVVVVAVRVDSIPEDSTEFGDGFVTKRGTFQKIYTQLEFREYISQELGVEPQVGGLGVLYIFKEPLAENEFLANKAFGRRLQYRSDLISSFEKDRTARSYVKLANKLGRPPLPQEFKKYDVLLERYGPRRLERLLLKQIDPDAFEGSRAERKEDILTWFAMMQFKRKSFPKLSELPPAIKADIKSFWPNYRQAKGEGKTFLFRMGKPDLIRKACRESPVGKLLPQDFYIHRSAEDELPALLRLVIFVAKDIVGEVGYELIKISLDGRAVSFLRYPDFDEVPHPELTMSLRVYLPRCSYRINDYSESPNPSILHRKETFLAPSHPAYEEYKKLTEFEEEQGLLSSKDIGRKREWEQLLEERGITLPASAKELQVEERL